jgi:tetratricopeptide (TPR) repeat protein
MNMKSPFDQRALQEVEGYLELGMLEDALVALDKLSPGLQISLEAISLRMEVYKASKDWSRAREIAEQLSQLQPNESCWFIDLAYATRRSESIEAAKKILLSAETRHPSEPLIKFNLGCYLAQTGDLSGAKAYVDKAISLEPSFRKIALEDPDLAPIRKALLLKI